MYKALCKIISSSSLLLILVISSDVFALSAPIYTQTSHSQGRNSVSTSQAVIRPWLSPQLAQREQRSRSDVMSDVKKRFNAKVLKISLNAQTNTYNVRILLPNGKVRNVKMSAER